MGDEMTKEEKACSKCHRTLRLDEFLSDKRRKDGKRSNCRSCHAESVASWRLRNPEKVREMYSQERRGDLVVAGYNRRYKQKNRSKINEAQRIRRSANPKQDRARDAVRLALRRGDITRPESCQRCGVTGRRIEASHDNYDQQLVIEWLCVRCHRRKDRYAKA